MGKRAFDIGVSSHMGNRKKINQDSVLIKVGEHCGNEFGLFAVADGMGGLDAGEEAGRIAVEGLNSWWNERLYGLIRDGCVLKPSNISCELEMVFEKINLDIKKYSDRKALKMGTTLTVIFIYEDRYFVKHIGDSRLYMLNSGIKKVTMDHSWVAREVQSGHLTEEEAKEHPRRNVLLQCLGVHDQLHTFTEENEIKANDAFLICSDGFHVYLSDKEMLSSYQETVENKFSSQYYVDLTVRRVLSKEALDNISCILIRKH